MPNDESGITNSHLVELQPTPLGARTSDSNIALRLKIIREMHGLSQRELSKRSGITNSNISMIEQGQVSPSIQSLARILNAFPMTLADFFCCDVTNLDKYVYSSSELIASRQATRAGESLQCLAAEKTDRQLDMQSRILPSGFINSLAATAADQSGFVIHGQLQLMIGVRVYELSAGDGFYIPRGVRYRISNTSSDSVKIITCSLFIQTN